MIKKIFLWFGLILLPTCSMAGSFSLGGEFWTWSSNFNFSQSEFFLPFSLCVDPAKDFSLYLQTELGVTSNPSYSQIGSLSGGPPYANLSGTTLGAQLKFEMGSVEPFVNVGLNMASGDLHLEKETQWFPFDLVDVPYQGVTSGISAMVGVELPEGTDHFTVAAGYMDPGVFNKNFDLPQGNINNSLQSDTFFISANHSWNFEDKGKEEVGVWALYHDVLQGPFGPYFQLGPSYDLYYRLENPQGFSLNSGFQLFLPSQVRPYAYVFNGYGFNAYYTGPLAPEAHNSRGPRLYLDPSFTTGQFTIEGQATYVAQNDYSINSSYYDGGGWLLGFGPLFRFPIGDTGAFKLSASFNKIIAINYGFNAFGNIDGLYDLFKIGAGYEVSF